MAQNYYEILGLSKTATDDDIKSVYRKLAIQYHPDKNQNSPHASEKFKKVTQAYETLRDPQKRKQYDIELTQPKPKPRRDFGQPFGRAKPTPFDMAEALRVFMANLRSDQNLREKFEGDAIAAYEPSRGSNIRFHVPLSLAEIAAGCTKTIKVKHRKPCDICQGKGSPAGKIKLITCSLCGGKGKVRVVGQVDAVACNACSGLGMIPQDPCHSCGGTGRTSGETTLSVKFPAGIAEGNYLVLSQMGDTGLRGGEPGDLVIYINEEPNEEFQRRGYNLETDVSVPVTTAILGGRASVFTLDGKPQTFMINSGTQPETLFCLQGFGLPRYHGSGKGDLYVRVHVDIPGSLTKKEHDLYEHLQKLSENEKKPHRRVGRYCVIDLDPTDTKLQYRAVFETAEMLIESHQAIALNFAQVKKFDSLVIGRLMTLHQKLKRFGEELVIFSAKKETVETLEDCNVHVIFRLVAEESQLDKESKTQGSTGRHVGHTRQVNGKWLVYAGEGDFAVAVFKSKKYAELINQTGNAVGLDLSDVTMVNSSTIGQWIKQYKLAKTNGAELFLYSPKPVVRTVLKETNLLKLFKITENEEELEKA